MLRKSRKRGPSTPSPRATHNQHPNSESPNVPEAGGRNINSNTTNNFFGDQSSFLPTIQVQALRKGLFDDEDDQDLGTSALKDPSDHPADRTAARLAMDPKYSLSLQTTLPVRTLSASSQYSFEPSPRDALGSFDQSNPSIQASPVEPGLPGSTTSGARISMLPNSRVASLQMDARDLATNSSMDIGGSGISAADHLSASSSTLATNPGSQVSGSSASSTSAADLTVRTKPSHDGLDEDFSIVRQYWSSQAADATDQDQYDVSVQSPDSFGPAPNSQVGSRPNPYIDPDQSDPDEPLFDPPQTTAARVKSMLPGGLYRSLANQTVNSVSYDRAEEAQQEEEEADGQPAAASSLIGQSSPPRMKTPALYDAPLHSPPPIPTVVGQTKKKPFSPVKSLLKMKTSRTFSRTKTHASTNLPHEDEYETRNLAAPPTTPGVVSTATADIAMVDASAGRTPEDPTVDEEDDTLLPLSPLPDLTSPRQAYTLTSRRQQSPPSQNRVMTKTQFDNYRKSIIEGGLRSALDGSSANESDDSDNDYNSHDDEAHEQGRRGAGSGQGGGLLQFDDDDDDKKQQIRMRLKQDAHLSVYRQKMTKVVGSQTALSSYLQSSGSVNNLDSLAADDADDEYDDVPLGILKAHGFPSSGSRLRAMQSQPDLQHQAATATNHTSVMYQQPLQFNDASSLRSATSRPDLRTSMSMDMRRSTFGMPATEGPANQARGLIGEIAREEEARIRRKSMGNLSGMLGAPGMLNSSSSSVYSNANPEPPVEGSLQAQMQQMMQMQVQLLQQIAKQNGPAPAHANAPRMGRAQSQQVLGRPQPTLKQHYSSYDVHAGGTGRAPSLRSLTPSDQSSGGNTRTSMPALRDVTGPELNRMSRSMTQPEFGAGPGLLAGAQPARRAGTMRLSELADEEDEDEDDAGWQELLQKRRGLKETWKKQTVAI